MSAQAVFHGTRREAQDLMEAINRNCECSAPMGVRLTTCSGHKMLIDQQRQLDGLLFDRHLRDRLRKEEGLDA